MSNRFKRGSGVYKCRVCGHLTRDTGGDGAGVGNCDLCHDLAGECNHISDNGGETYEKPEFVRQMLAALDKRNGVACAADLFPEVAKAVSYGAAA